jgi:hypothetical protein
MTQDNLFNSLLILFVGISIIYICNTPATVVLISPNVSYKNVKHYTSN